MKNSFLFLFSLLICIGLLTQGFGCGSPDLEGAKIYVSQKNYEGAIPLLEKETKKNPANEEAWYLLGETKGMIGDYEGMNIAFSNSMKVSDKYSGKIRFARFKYWADHINAAVPYMKSASDSVQNYDKAINEYQKAVSAYPDTTLTYYLLVKAYHGKVDIDNTIVTLEKIWNMSQDKETYKSAGQLYIQQGLSKKEQFKLANADKLRIQNNLNEISKGSYKSDVMRMLGAPDSQKKDKKNPKKEDWKYNQYAMTLTVEGDRIVNKKIDKKIDLKIDSTKYREAIVKFNKAVNVFETLKAADPKDNENLNLLLQAYYEANRVKEATKAFKLAVDNEPGNKMNHYILGLLYKTEGKYDEAIAEFDQANKIDPNFIDVIYELGATYINWGVKLRETSNEKGDESTEYKKKFQEALPWMEKVVQIKNDDIKIWDTLGRIYALMGQGEKASKAYDEADKLRKAGK